MQPNTREWATGEVRRRRRRLLPSRERSSEPRDPTLTNAQAAASFVANAQCMRKHGVPDFPDPVFAPGGQGIGYNVSPGSFAYETQGILRASRECRSVGSSLPLRMLVQAAP